MSSDSKAPSAETEHIFSRPPTADEVEAAEHRRYIQELIPHLLRDVTLAAPVIDEHTVSTINSASFMRVKDDGVEIPTLTHGFVQRPPDSTIRYHLLRLTARLGLPLLFRILPEGNEAKQRAEAWLRENDAFEADGNPVLRVLSFGSGVVEGDPRPNLCIIRADGKKIDSHQVYRLYDYAEAKMRAYFQSHEESLDTFYAEMTPEKFVKYWEDFPWKTVDAPRCPVTLNCKACGKEAHLRCGKCGAVKYCDVACQKANWATHKKVCVKAWEFGSFKA